jgi:hypothetical protein
MKKAFLIAAILAASFHPAKTDQLSCYAVKDYEKVVNRLLDAAAGFDALAQGNVDSFGGPMTDARRAELKRASEDDIQQSKVWADKLALAQARCK